MEENKKKFTAFKPATLLDWEVAAREELNGANPWEKLVYQGNDWSIRPIYDRNRDIASPALLSASENKFLGARSWFNCPYLIVEDSKETNEKALEHLREGADGIFFELNDEVNFEILLKDIEWQYCSLNFLVKKNLEANALGLHHFISKRKIDQGHLHGAFFGNTVASPAIQSPFRFGGVRIEPSSAPVDEMVAGFNQLTVLLRKDYASHADGVALSVPVGKDFFVEIAKLRALRVVWNKILTATKIKTGAPLFIHAYSPAWIEKNYQPHGNMLKGTTAAMAAILGGCDALTIHPEDVQQSMMTRVARNVSNILREESHFSKVADAVAGSYFIEDLTHELASATWKSIQPQLAP